MELTPVTYEQIIEWLRKHTAMTQFPIIVDARLAVSLDEAKLGAFHQTPPLKVIQY